MRSHQNPRHDLTRTEALVDAAHSCTWGVDGDRLGRCRCGQTMNTEDEWRRHAEAMVIDELWSPAAPLVTSVAALDDLPARTVIVVHPGAEDTIFRSVNLGDPGPAAWCNLTGTFRFTPAGLLPALILERGPERAGAPATPPQTRHPNETHAIATDSAQ